MVPLVRTPIDSMHVCFAESNGSKFLFGVFGKVVNEIGMAVKLLRLASCCLSFFI